MALTLMVGVAMGLAVGAAMAARATTQSAISAQPITPAARSHAAGAPAAAAAAPMAAYRQLVASMKVAESSHDFAARYRFDKQLKAMLTAKTIGSIYLEHSRLVSSLATAKENREYHAVSMINQRIAAICGPKMVKAQLDFCN